MKDLSLSPRLGGADHCGIREGAGVEGITAANPPATIIPAGFLRNGNVAIKLPRDVQASLHGAP
jgi:hypothetical protein